MSDRLPRSSYAPRSAETRERVAAATRDTIQNQGLNAVKVRLIAKAARTSVGTVYNLFGHLDDLIRHINGETYDSLYAHQIEALQDARNANLSAREQLSDLADAYLDWVSTHQALWLATLAFNRSRPESPPNWYRAKEQALLRIVEDALTGFPAGLEARRRQDTARALWGAIHGIVSMAVADRSLMQSRADVTRQMHIIVDAVADGLERETP